MDAPNALEQAMISNGKSGETRRLKKMLNYGYIHTEITAVIET